MVERRKGIVKWFKEEKGYGRIMLDGIDGNHVFVHFSEIISGNSYKSLKEGKKVVFDLIEIPNASDSQQLTAKNVEIIDDEHV
ncbi:cold shock domain-containing protein [Pullulanibacillus sp. KACC 23026]|uniref:cold-shock protein n=1 Tax=Pullulanibacillus sp. KACC 23026 TaxID=3028315 RepID=UPI0023B1FB6B|nr:cold shock domain-containing protein [Pullulanibacillus sp. KACC 23026]WEG12234.1 cold shock domain-containing protein [Pullulanibacillus sp. KACC 23026]